MNNSKQIRTLGFLLLLLLAGTSSQAQLAKIMGTLTDQGQTLPLTNMQLRDGSTIVSRTMTDQDGKYTFAKVEPGQYQIYVKFGEYDRTFPIVLSPGETELKDLALTVEGPGTTIYGAKEIFTTDPMVVTTIPREELKVMSNPRTGPLDMIASIGGGVTQTDHGDPLNLRGARSGGTVTFIDGQKVQGTSQVPFASINQISLISGGIPAEYGDVTGGIILINTYNPGMKGSAGKPLTRQERKAIRLKKKQSRKSSFGLGDDRLLVLN